LSLSALLKRVREVEMKLHSFLTSVPDGGKWSTSRPGRFIFGK